jgi:integrase
MKVELTKSAVQGFEHPAGGNYIVTDDHPDAPTGFGLRVSKTVKTYVVKLRVSGKMVTATVGRHPELLLGRGVPPERNARFLAGAIVARLRGGEDVNAVKREEAIASRAGAKTLGDLFDDWRHGYLNNPKRKARPNTLLAVQKARERLGDVLMSRPADKLSYKELEVFFQEKAKEHLTASEQTIRWVSAVYNRANDQLQLDALEADVEPTLYRNPAKLLAMKGYLRDKSELERDYAKKGVRRPLSGQAMGFRRWMDYILDARSRFNSRTAADYMLVTVVMGYRRMETKTLKWRHRMKDSEAAQGNFVDMENRLIVLHVTKNRYMHVLPIPDYLYGLLCERRELVGKKTPWVFPAYSRSPLRKVEHYSDSRGFMDGVTAATNVRFSEHDLRRTFGNIMSQLKMPTTVAKQLLNHKQGDGVTGLYTAQSNEQLVATINEIETEMLSYATAGPKGQPKTIA